MLYVITHKDVPLLAKGPDAKLLFVGAGSGRERRPDCEYDDVGDNIAGKNAWYSELTGLYYLSKNCRDDVVGVCHYRRLFSDSGLALPLERTVGPHRIPAFDFSRVRREIARGVYDLVLPARRLLLTRRGVKTIYSHFAYHKGASLFDAFLQVVEDVDPDVSAAYRAHVHRARRGSYWNMIIARNDVFREVCERVFRVLFELERRLRATEAGLPARSLGYLSESLLPFYAAQKNRSVRYKNVVFVERV